MKLTADHVAALADIAAPLETWVRRPASHPLLDLEGAGMLAHSR